MAEKNMLSKPTSITLGSTIPGRPSSRYIYYTEVKGKQEGNNFTNINFVGLTDTRRLLLDYFEEKASWSTHISNDKNYNHILYDITLSY